jgi:DNA gyrase subunit B
MELVANSIEDHLDGRCSSITVIIHDDGSASVRDDGPGISIAARGDNIPFVEKAFTTLYSGSERDRKYRVWGRYGVGPPCVNALSEWMLVTTVSEGEEYQIAFARGKVKEPLRKCPERKAARGTTIRFKPDSEIFGDKTFESNLLKRTLEHVAMLHPGLDLWFVDERANSINRALVSHYLFPNGSADYLELLLPYEPYETGIYPRKPVQISGEESGVKVSVAFQFAESMNTWILSFANSSETPPGGNHVTGFLHGITHAINQFAGSRRRFHPHEVRVGLSAIVSVWLGKPKYGGAMSSELINPEVEEVVRKLTFEKVRAWIEEIQKSDDSFIDRLEKQRSRSFGEGED